MTTISPAQAARRANRANASTAPSPARAAGRANGSIPTAFLAGARKATKDMTAKERFATMQERFDTSKTSGVDVRFQFELSGSGGGTWYVEIKNGKLTVKSGTGPNPTATLKASAEDYVKIANGEMNKVMAVIRGKLKVDGDKDALGKFDTYFKN